MDERVILNVHPMLFMAAKLGEIESRLRATGAEQKVRAVMEWHETRSTEDRESLAFGDHLAKIATPLLRLQCEGELLDSMQLAAIQAFIEWKDKNLLHHDENNARLLSMLKVMFAALDEAKLILAEAKALGLPIRYQIPGGNFEKLRGLLRNRQ